MEINIKISDGLINEKDNFESVSLIADTIHDIFCKYQNNGMSVDYCCPGPAPYQNPDTSKLNLSYDFTKCKNTHQMKTMISKSFEILSNYFNDKYKIKGYPVHIGITSGVIIKVLTLHPERDNIFSFINYAKEKYHVYGLRHLDNDILEPCSINKNSTLVNRFGWYVTEQEIDFSDNNEIDLKELGISYYDVTNNSFRKTCHPCCIEIDVEKYFKDSYKFWNTTLDYKEYI